MFHTGLTLQAVFLMLCALGYFGNSITWVIVFLSLSVGLSSFPVAGSPVNNLELTKICWYSIGHSVANMIGTIPGFLGPQVAKLIAEKVRSI